MIISDLDYLSAIPATTTPRLTGAEASALSAFSTFTWGHATHTSTVVENKVSHQPYRTLAFSAIRARSTAAGPNAFTMATSSSSASVRVPSASPSKYLLHHMFGPAS